MIRIPKALLTLPLSLLLACPPSADSGGDGGTLLPDGGRRLPDGGTAPDTTPKITSVEARAAGRKGQDLVLVVDGSDPDADVLAASLTLLDAAGAQVSAFSSHPGTPADTGATLAPFETALATRKTFTDARVTLRGVLGRAPTTATVRVALVDSKGQLSELRDVPLTPQQELQLGEPCDKTLVQNRCPPSTACRGTPAACAEGTAPTVSKLVYAASDAGVVLIRWTGADADDDIQQLEFTFRDASGQPILADLDGDGTPEANQYVHDVTGTSVAGKFTGALDPSASVAESVPQLAVKPKDEAGNDGTVTTAPLSTIVTRNVGSACDPLGADACKAGSVCFPGVVGVSNACQQLATARRRRCDTAPLLDISAGKLVALDRVEGSSAWTPSCAESVPSPEGVVKLKVSEELASLTLTTDGSGTTFDTVLTVLSGTACEAATTVEGCNDDAAGVTTVGSTLQLSNVAPGTYFVVIDSLKPEGGDFVLRASVP
ncbi:MAG: hypothetical protein RL653_1045 [Pseudomonadota bacterium]|jgi:hypothetical protein